MEKVKAKSFLFTCLFLMMFGSISAQKFQKGLYFGGNMSFTSLNSDYELEGNTDLRSGLGGYFSFVMKYHLSEKINLNGDIGYALLTKRDKSEMYFTNPSAEPIKMVERRTIFNNFLQSNVLISFELFRNFYIGTGLSANYLMYSFSYFKTDLETDKKIYRNKYYRSFLINIPIRLEYTITEKYSITLSFHKGIHNSLKGGDSYIKEIDNSITLGMGIYFGNNSED